MTMSALSKLGAARLLTLEKMPYFSSLLLSMIPRKWEGPGVPETLAVTPAGVMLYHPAAVERWSVPHLATVILHEGFHLLRDHSGRCHSYGADPKVWNLCADAEINDDLVAAKLEFPTTDQPVLPKTLGQPDGKLAEEYYANLRAQAKNAFDKAKKEGGRGVGHGACGGAAGNPHDNEPKDGDGPSAGQSPGRSEADLQNMRRDVAAAMQEAHNKQAGSVPGDWLRWAEDHMKPPKVPWQRKLARACRGAVANRAGAVDYTYRRPSRRQWGVGVGPGRPILPTMRAPTPYVAVAVDTSGSMGANELGTALSEVRGVMAAVGASVEFFSCDAIVHAAAPVKDFNQLKKLLVGGGGTDFRPVFEALDKLSRKPDVLVFCTDGYGPAPEAPPPGVHTIWVLVGANPARPCSWGDQIVVES